MASSTEYKLKFQIDADAKKAKAELSDLDKILAKVGAKSSLKDVVTTAKSDFGDLESAAHKLAGSIPVPFAAAATAIAGVTAGIAGVGLALYGMVRTAADFGSEIHDAGEKTGLTAKTISSLKFAADESSSSLEQMTSGIAKFSKTVGEAADGSDKAAAKLKSLGIEPKDAINDLDGALGKVFKKIADAPPGIERTTLAQKAFGKAGAELIPTILSFNGNLGELIDQCEKLGVTIDDKAARAADEFGDQMDTLSKQITGVKVSIGNELMPVFLDMARDVSSWLSQNKGEVKAWADNLSFGIREAIANWNRYAAVLERVGDATEQVAGLFIAGGGDWKGYGQRDVSRQQRIDRANAFDRGEDPDYPGGMRPDIGEGYLPGGKKSGAKTSGNKEDSSGGGKTTPPKTTDSEFRKFFEQFGFHVNRTFGKAINEGSLHPSGKAIDLAVGGKTEDQIARVVAAAIEKGYRFVDERVSQKGVKSTGKNLHFEQNLGEKGSIFAPAGMYGNTPLDYLKGLDSKRLGKGGAGTQVDIAQWSEEQKAERIKNAIEYWHYEKDQANEFASFQIQLFGEQSQTRLLTLQQALEEGAVTETRYAEQVGGIKIDQLNQQLALYGNVKSATYDENKVLIIGEKITQQTLENLIEQDKVTRKLRDSLQDVIAKEQERFNIILQGQIAQGAGVLDSEKPGTEQSKSHGSFLDALFGGMSIDEMQNDADARKAIMTDLGNTVGDIFGAMANAVGSAIEGWALYGESLGSALKKATAAVLAETAAQAAVKAIFQLAEGFASLAFGDARGAALHFTAAAIYGTIAVGAAIGARVIGGGGKGNTKSQSGSKGTSSSVGQSGKVNSEDLKPYSRQTDDAFVSGRNDHPARFVADAVDRLTKKIDSMRPGDVLVAGTREKPGHIGQQVAKDIDRDAGIGKRILQKSGVR